MTTKDFRGRESFSLDNVLALVRCMTAASAAATADVRVEIFLEQREVAFLSPRKILRKFEFFYFAPLKIQIFANFAGW